MAVYKRKYRYAPCHERGFVWYFIAVAFRQNPVAGIKHRYRYDGLARFSFGVKEGFTEKWQ
jgi:hypothetical protein